MTTDWWQWRPKSQRQEEELEENKNKILEWQRRATEPWPNPFEAWEGLGRGISGFLHTFPQTGALEKPTPYEEIPELSVGMPWTSPFTGEQARLGTKGAAEFLPDVIALSKAPASLGMKLWRAFPFAGKPMAEKVVSLGVRTVAAPIIAAEEAIPAAKRVVAPLKTMMNRAQFLLPERTLTRTAEQTFTAHRLARTKNLLYKSGKQKGKVTPTYRRLAELYTGKKTMKDMNRQEADTFIKAIESLEVIGGKPPKLPKTMVLIGKEFWDSIPAMKDVGILDYFRQKPKVLQMLGMDDMADMLMREEVTMLTEKQTFLKGIAEMEKSIGKDAVRRERIFDALEKPIESHLLDPDEQEIFLSAKVFFDAWADRLKIPLVERRKDYITHIFDKQLQQDAANNRTLPLEIMKAMEFQYPKKTYMPFLKQRLGKEVGLKKDPFKAMEVYEAYALRDFYYKPFLQKLSAYIQMFEARGKMSTANYLKDMARRVAGRPSKDDILINTDLGKLGTALSKVIKGDAGLRLETLSKRGNLGALVAYNMSSLLYMAWLGFRPVSAIRNLSQQLLAAADVGPANLAKGIGLRFTAKGKRVLRKSLVYQGRLLGEPVAGLEEAQLRRLPLALQQKSLAMFKLADKQNVVDSFLAGYAKGKKLGLDEEWAIRLGDEVAASTQYYYTRMARSLFEESVAGRFLSPFTSWPRNFTELMAGCVQGKQSTVFAQ